MEQVHYSVTFPDDAPPDSGGDLVVIPEEKAWFPAAPGSNAPINWWQIGGELQPVNAERANAVYACRKVLSEEMSRLRAHHYRRDEDGGKTPLHSMLSRVLRFPNSWQTSVDFWLNMMDALLRDGNAYAIAGYEDRGAINSLTQLRAAHPYVDPQTNEIFYGVGIDSGRPMPDAEEVDPARMVPSRLILHLRLFTPVHPLMGESPLVAAVVSANTGTAISNSNYSFFNRAARPSGYLRHPKQISNEARLRLKEAWTNNYSGSGTGGTAVLEEGLEWHPMTMSAVDAEIVDSYKLTVADISRVFRVPLFMLGDLSEVNFNTVEQLTRTFMAGGLGFYLRLIEEKIAQFFGLPTNEWVEFDVEAGLLRTEFKDRIEGLTRGVQGGVYTPNEARAREGLAEVEGGDTPLVQQQMVPLDAAANQTLPNDNEPESDPEPAEEEPLDAAEVRAMVRRRLKVV